MRFRATVACVVLLALAAGRVAADDLDQRLAAANPKRGQLLYMQCRACHDVEPGLPHKVGVGTAGGYKLLDVRNLLLLLLVQRPLILVLLPSGLAVLVIVPALEEERVGVGVGRQGASGPSRGAEESARKDIGQ